MECGSQRVNHSPMLKRAATNINGAVEQPLQRANAPAAMQMNEVPSYSHNVGPLLNRTAFQATIKWAHSAFLVDNAFLVACPSRKAVVWTLFS